MNRFRLTIICISLFCSVSTTSFGQDKAIVDAAIEKAISNFVKCRLSKQYNAFDVWLFEKGEYDRYEIPDNLITISILAETAPLGPPFPITDIDTLGSTRLPTRHIVKDGKLFYWYDPDYGLTKETIDVFLRFNLAEYLPDSSYEALMNHWFSRRYVNDSLKGAHYYFCKDDLSKYKRVITSIATGWYEPPKVRCKSLK